MFVFHSILRHYFSVHIIPNLHNAFDFLHANIYKSMCSDAWTKTIIKKTKLGKKHSWQIKSIKSTVFSFKVFTIIIILEFVLPLYITTFIFSLITSNATLVHTHIAHTYICIYLYMQLYVHFFPSNFIVCSFRKIKQSYV